MRPTEDLQSEINQMEWNLSDYAGWYQEQQQALLLGVEVLIDIRELLLSRQQPEVGFKVDHS